MKKIKSYLGAASFLFIMQHASAQTNYINHTLKTGETLSAIAKEYNTNVGDIMRMNGMHADTKLVYGSNIKVPSNKSIKKEITSEPPVVKQTAALPANAANHVVEKGETLFSISKKYNVSTAQIKTWNNLPDNSVKIGSVLIVGNASAAQPATQTAVETTHQRVDNTNTQQQDNTPSSMAAQASILQGNANNNNAVVAQQQNEIADRANDNSTTLSNPKSDGYFADMFQKNGSKKSMNGATKVFKTASGWSDNKYYVLVNDINPGTIVKLTADNGKSVYAKVLWSMGDMKENNGINFRISDATAAALNENDQQFNLALTY